MTYFPPPPPPEPPAFDWPPPAPAARRPVAEVPGRPFVRRHLGGVALTLAFVPVGWVVSAAVFGDGDTSSAVTRAGVEQDFRLGAARAGIGRSSLVARVRGDRVRLHTRPGGSVAGAAGARIAGKPGEYRARVVDGRTLPIVFRVRARRGDWLQVELPTRPNFSTAWIRAEDARLRVTPYALRVNVERHRLTLFRDGKVAGRWKVGLGASVAPTPTGRYYLTDLIRPPSPDGLYGAYAFGLSGHSRVLSSFGTGDGQIGLHGTNDPSSLGGNVSHGCIRVSNAVIRRLARDVPLGSPITIR